jgi:hypothetical protein
MRQQPDFSKLFHDFSGGSPRKLTYSVRRDSNRGHDIVFLDSFIRGARFTMADFKLRGKRLSINIKRDCWELPIVRRDGVGELYIADARLYIADVLSVEWRNWHPLDIDASAELWITDIRLGQDERDGQERLTIFGWRWFCRIALAEDNIKIKLTDKEVPYLYTERHKE